MIDNSLPRSYYGECFRVNHLNENIQVIFDQLLKCLRENKAVLLGDQIKMNVNDINHFGCRYLTHLIVAH